MGYWESASQAAQPSKQDSGFWDNIEGIGGLATGLVTGLPSLAEGIAQIPVGFARLGVDAAKEATGHGEGFSSDYGTNLGEYFPLLEQLRSSGTTTVDRLTHPGRYVDAYQQGRLAPALFEDAANVSLVGGLAARGLSAASGAEAAAAPAATVDELASSAAAPETAARFQPRFPAPATYDAPTATRPALLDAAQRLQQATDTASGAINPLTWPGRVTGAVRAAAGADVPVLSPAAQRLTAAASRLGSPLQGVGDSLLVTPETAPFKEAMFGAQDVARENAAPILRGGMAVTDLLPGENAQRALFANQAGLPSILGPLYDRLTPAQFDQAVNTIAERGRFDLTPEAARQAVELARGNVPPEQQALYDQARDVWQQQVAQPAQDRFLTGYGESQRLTPSQLIERNAQATSNEPLSYETRPVEAKYEPQLQAAQQRLGTAQMQADLEAARRTTQDEITPRLPGIDVASSPSPEHARALADVGLAQDEYDRLSIERQNALSAAADKITSAPARYRPMLAYGRTASTVIDDMASTASSAAEKAALSSVKADIITSLADAVTSGTNPEYLQGGTLPGRVAGATPATPGVLRKIGSEYVKEAGTGPLTARGQTIISMQRVAEQARNEAVRQISENPALAVRAGDHLDITEGTPGAAIVAEMANGGRVPWDPTNPRGKVNAADVTGDTLFVPKWLPKGFDRFTASPGAWEQAARTLVDKPTRALKAGVLALSPHWVVGHVIGHALLNLAGGVTPADFVRYGREAADIVKSGEQSPNLASRGFTADQNAFARSWEHLDPARATLTDVGAPGRSLFGGRLSAVTSDLGDSGAARLAQRTANVVEHPVQSSYRLVSFFDNISRQVHYMAKKGEGYSDAGAVKSALDTLGDFQHQLPWERQVVFRLFPFASWTKHITQLAYRLARDDPTRVAWTLHLSDLFQPGDVVNDVPFLRGAMPLGGNRFMPLNNFNPFSHVANVMDPTDVGGNLTPLLRTPFEAVTGEKIGHVIGGPIVAPLTRPPGSGGVDPSGHETAKGWLGDPIEAAYALSGILPQTRFLRDQVGPFSDPVIRYDTGEPIVSRTGPFGTSRFLPAEDQNLLSDISSFLGVPVPINYDTQGFRQRRDSRLARLRAANAAYEQAVG